MQGRGTQLKDIPNGMFVHYNENITGIGLENMFSKSAKHGLRVCIHYIIGYRVMTIVKFPPNVILVEVCKENDLPRNPLKHEL